MDPDSTTIGFIGTGVMGKSMAGHLINAGYSLHIYTRTKTRAESLIARGATWHDTPAGLARSVNVIFTIVGFPPDVEAVYFGENGILANLRSGSYLIDMTTSSPELAVRIAEKAREKNCRSLDAPVSGGDVGAKEARLSIMVGGEKEAFDRILPLFKLMGQNIVYQGNAGSGQHCKMCNQIAIASNMLGVCEAMAYARASGLDPETVLQSIAAGAARARAAAAAPPPSDGPEMDVD